MDKTFDYKSKSLCLKDHWSELVVEQVFLNLIHLGVGGGLPENSLYTSSIAFQMIPVTLEDQTGSLTTALSRPFNLGISFFTYTPYCVHHFLPGRYLSWNIQPKPWF